MTSLMRRIETSAQAFENIVDIIHPTDGFSLVSDDGEFVKLRCPAPERTLTDACLWAEAELKGSFVIPTVEAHPRYGDGVWEYLIMRV